MPLQAYLDNRLQLFDVLEFILLQTGPAKRADMKTIGRHTALLKERFGKEHLEVYELLTKSIIKKYNSQKSDI